jgi:ankyrin repeat protein
VKDEDGQTTVMAAAMQGYSKYLSLLIERGIDPNARTKSGKVAAHWAASYSNFSSRYDQFAKDKSDRAVAVEMLRVLASHGADLSMVDDERVAPLHNAARAGYVETLRFLLEYGGDPDLANAKRERPVFLSIVSSVDSLPKVKLLIDKGANVNLAGPGGTTPLMLAAKTRNRAMLMYLLEHHADANAIDDGGSTALNVSAASVGEQFVKPRDYAAMVAALAGATLETDHRDKDGMTALMWASISNIPEAMTVLIGKGANVNARSADGRSVLAWAACANADRAIPLLLDRGADRNAKDNSGRTAFDWSKTLEQPVAGLVDTKSKNP